MSGTNALIVCKKGIFVEVDVVAEGEGVGEAVGADGPVFGDGGFDLHGVVAGLGGGEFDEPIIELSAGPDCALVLGESGVEGGDAGALVVAENHLVVVVVGGAGGEEEDKEEREGSEGGVME